MIFEVSVPVAFVAGIVSFFAPCVVPLLPAYIGYVTGVSFSELKNDNHHKYRKKVLISSLFYILGFSLLFVIAGTAAASISGYFASNRVIIQRIGGLVILILGLQFADILKLSFFSRERKFKLPKGAERLGYFRSFIVGIIFATAWSPCIGPIYGAILSLAAISSTATHGAFLLFIYSLGISLPFLIVSMTLASAPKYLKSINKHIGILTKASGILLAILGILILTDTYRYLYAWILDLSLTLGVN